jgi:hypothetical protein
MNEPVRLRDTGGAARVLLGAGKLQVPHTSRQRALAFTGVAAGVATTGTATAAGATSLFKSVVLCVCLGTVGGGLTSLAVSETVSRLQTPSADARPAPTPKRAITAPKSPSAAATADATSEPTLTPTASVFDAAPAERAALPDARANAVAPAAGAPVTAAPPAANVSNVEKPARAASLFDEQRIIESARAAVSRGDAQGALATLDGYDHSYAQGQFGPEALALRIEALSAKGDLARARSLAAEFQRRYPHHPLLAPVQTAVQGPSTTKH